MMTWTTRLVLVAVAVFCACAAQPKQAEQAKKPEQAAEPALLFEGLGTHKRKVSTQNEKAQIYFDQGMALSYAFNHDEAARSFVEAAKLDPQCGMAWWGNAYAIGPNYNSFGVTDENAAAAYASLQRAAEGTNSPVERDLIDALSTRFEDPPPKDRRRLNEGYAKAMASVWKKYPDDADVAFLYADALLNLQPWNLWTRDGKPIGNSTEIVETLERGLKININHPGVNHLYIHIIEASSNPGKAEAAADRLGALMPGSGHLVHMPSHIYVQIGRYMDSVECNTRASELDREYFAKVGQKGDYHFYHIHNDHFLVWSAMFQGRYEDALAASDAILRDLPEDFRGIPDAADFLVSKLHVYIRFGRWEEAIKSPMPRKDQPYAVAMWHYARGVAFANTGRFKEAQKEATAFDSVAKTVPEDQLVFVVPAPLVLRVAREMMAGEIAFKSGEFDAAFKHLRAAVEAEDSMPYSEPNPWLMPTRHALGALLLQQGESVEAEKCYREDLAQYPGNGWSLHGLAECLERRGADDEATAVRQRFDKAWANATITIKASCFCRTK
jgi:tetratricopeptide (TPR) repeat protein